MLDLGLLMYVGLLVLAVWRSVCFYRCCGLWLSLLSYASLLYVILVASLSYSLFCLYKLINEPLHSHAADTWSIGWLHPLVTWLPGLAAIIVVLGFFQSEGHIFEIQKRVGILRHDRAVQIIALPAVFAVMAVASMVPIYELVTGNIDAAAVLDRPFGIELRPLRDMTKTVVQEHGRSAADKSSLVELYAVHPPLENSHIAPAFATFSTDDVPAAGHNSTRWDEATQVALWQYETCFYVADLFEAWALYQFGRLALEMVGDTYLQKKRVLGAGMEQEVAEDLLASHAAMASLTWLGTIIFVVVCVVQTGCALYPYAVGTIAGQNNLMGKFQVAGFVASGAAIYNLFVVERAFHHHLQPNSPLLKFLSVKILVSLSFFQRGLLVALQAGEQVLPEVIQKIVRFVPLVGDILQLSEIQMHLFYPCLILVECLLASVMHLWAWRSAEAWYQEESTGTEEEPLLLLEQQQQQAKGDDGAEVALAQSSGRPVESA